MTTLRTLALGAGAGCLTLAVFVQGFLPWLTPESRDRRVTRAVRNELGAVTWLWHDAAPYTPLEARGRAAYIREGCWYCHSQYVRPVAGEELRWGPLSEAGEYHFDLPHLLGTRRVGPDLSRVGGKYGDDWHYAHHWDPRLVVPDSNMPAFRWLFETLTVGVRQDGAAPALAADPALARHFTLAPEPRVPLRPNPAGLAFVSGRGPDGRVPGTPVLDLSHLKDARPSWATVTLIRPSLDLVGLVAYLQRLGSDRGAWRDVFEPQELGITGLEAPRSPRLARGREVYHQRCAGCHGPEGDGNGPVATFLDPRPRSFTTPSFRFRSTPSGALPTDGDLYRTLTRGLRGTAMPGWHELRETDRLAVLQYLKTFAPEAWAEPPEPPLAVPEPPRATGELLARGRDVYRHAMCGECHGEDGQGHGPSAAGLRTDDGFPIRATDLRQGVFKAGSHVRDVFRTLSTGLNGTPMPSYADALDEEARWALAYFVLSLSAFTDPRTGAPLRLDPETRAALNRPGTALGAANAYDPAGAGPGERRRYRFGLLGGPPGLSPRGTVAGGPGAGG